MSEAKEKRLGYVKLPTSWIEVPRDRVTSVFEPETLTELKESVKAKGILVPLSVLYVNGRYYLIDGLHRLEVAKELGISEVPCLVKEGDEYDLIIENLIANRMRGRSNPAQEAMLVKKMRDEWGWSFGEIARKLGISNFTAKQLYDVTRLPEQVLQYVAMGKLSIGKAWLLREIPDPRDQIKAAEDIVKFNYTESQVRELVKYYLEAYQEVGVPSTPSVVKPTQEIALNCEICNKRFEGVATYHWICEECWSAIMRALESEESEDNVGEEEKDTK